MKFKIKLTFALAILPGLLLLSCGSQSTDVGPPKPEYTKADPGRWVEIAEDHLPEIKFVTSPLSDKIHIELKSRNWSENHYIEKIGIMDKKTKRDLAVQEFPRGTFVFDADFDYDFNDKDVKVYVKCNLHDLWTVDDLERFR